MILKEGVEVYASFELLMSICEDERHQDCISVIIY